MSARACLFQHLRPCFYLIKNNRLLHVIHATSLFSFTQSYLASSFLPIKVGIEVPLEGPTRIIETQLLVKAVDLLDVFSIKLEVSLEIRLDAAFRFALGENSTTTQGSAIGLSFHSCYVGVPTHARFPKPKRPARLIYHTSYRFQPTAEDENVSNQN